MTIGYINFRAAKNVYGFANIFSNSTSIISIPGTSWSAGYIGSGGYPGDGDTSGGFAASSGDAAWVPEDSARESHYAVAGEVATLLVTGLASGQAVKVTCFSRSKFDRNTRWTVGSEPSQDLAPFDEATSTQNTDQVVVFETSASVSGELEISHEPATVGSSSRATAIMIEEIAGPTVTTTDTLQPGEPFTLTATNYASAPVSPVTLTDSQGSTITVPVTISGSGPYTCLGTMPTLAEAVTAGTSLLLGDVTVELTT